MRRRGEPLVPALSTAGPLDPIDTYGRRTVPEADPFDVDDDAPLRPYLRPAVRTAAGVCPSCDGPIDAVTSECRCSE